MIASYPPEFLAFFGADTSSLLTPAGYLGMYAFSMLPFIVGIFAVIAGSGLIVSDEEHGRLDLIVAHPVGRPSFFWGRCLGLLGASLSIMLLGWLGFSVLLGRSSLGFSAGQMAVPFLSLLIQTLVYATFGLLYEHAPAFSQPGHHGLWDIHGDQLFHLLPVIFGSAPGNSCQVAPLSLLSDRPIHSRA